MEITSPSLTVMPPGAVNFFALVSTSISSAPQTQVLPIPRATTAAWLVLPPGRVGGGVVRGGVRVVSLGAAGAGLAHPAGASGRVAGLAAAAGEDALGGDH